MLNGHNVLSDACPVTFEPNNNNALIYLTIRCSIFKEWRTRGFRHFLHHWRTPLYHILATPSPTLIKLIGYFWDLCACVPLAVVGETLLRMNWH